MNILLIGYGRMGQAIESAARIRGHHIGGRINASGNWEKPLPTADVAIEFTRTEAAERNIRHCIDRGIPVLSGTTGWLQHKEGVDQYCREKGGTFFYASNFSMGVNLFFRLNQQLATLMKVRHDYQVSIEETHHTGKKDAPSGTAITLAQGIIANLPHKEKWTPGGNPDPRSIVITSKRIDPAPGMHEVIYRSGADEIRIRHEAFSREGFASGALDVAEWLPGKKGVLGMDDFLPR